MFTCAVLCAPWGVLPRETISGFFGRKMVAGSDFAAFMVDFIDTLHPSEQNHCVETYRCEQRMRQALYS
jgi:hypothetical protein